MNCILLLLIQFKFGNTDVLASNFVAIEDYKLTEASLIEFDMAKDKTMSRIKCFSLCFRMGNCQSVSMKKDSSRCSLYDVSVAGIGSTPVADADWDTYVQTGIKLTVALGKTGIKTNRTIS